MVTLRIASIDDAPELARIYSHYVEDTAISFEYTAPDAKEFADRIAHKLEKYPFIVAVCDGRCIGYAYASQLRERKSYDWCAELSVYIDKNHLRKGIGKRLFYALIDILTKQNFAMLYSGVTAPNAASEALHECFGFKRLGVTKSIGFKNGSWRDVIWFEKQINYFLGEPPAEIIPFPELDKRVIENALSRY